MSEPWHPADRFLDALGDPDRLDCVRALSRGSATVTELAVALRTPIVLVADRLAVLLRAGVVEELPGLPPAFRLTGEYHLSHADLTLRRLGAVVTIRL